MGIEYVRCPFCDSGYALGDGGIERKDIVIRKGKFDAIDLVDVVKAVYKCPSCGSLTSSRIFK